MYITPISNWSSRRRRRARSHDRRHRACALRCLLDIRRVWVYKQKRSGLEVPDRQTRVGRATGIRALRPPAESTTNPPDFDPSLTHRAGSTVRRCVSVNWPATGRLSWRRGCAMPRAWRGAGSCSRGESGQRERARPTHAEGDVAIPRGITRPWESAYPNRGVLSLRFNGSSPLGCFGGELYT